MAYMTRMGLWGPGSAFRDFDSFLSSLRQRGVTFMEMLAMEMKAEGKYVARGLSFRDAEFCEVECRLGEEQIAMYNDAVELWKDLRACLGPALAATGATPQTVWRTFWSTFQRFFKLLCVSCKVPTVVREAKAALAEGFCVVIGLQTTGEAAAEALALEPGAQCGWVSTTREMLERFVNDYFPTKRPPDNKTAATAAPEELIEDPKWLQNKATLLKRIRELELPPNFLDEIIHELGGPCCVAEMTGRRGRVVSVGQNPPTYQLRAPTDSSALDSLNTQEKDAFNSGEKLVAVISDAASTGISLHSCPRFQNKRRRLHITVELPWSADKAIQQLGRTHRSNQETGPLYKLVITDLGGEKRFAAAVARRLQSLGALTRGDRRAASGIDLSSSNLDSPLGRKALRRMYDNLVTESQHLPPGVHLSTVVGVEESKHRIDEAAKAALYPMAPEQLAIQRLHRELREAAKIMEIGLEGRRSDSVAESKMSGSNSGLGDVRRFLNRLLGLPVSRQNLLFGYLSATLAAETRSAIQEGRHSEGFSDLSCSSYSLDTRSVFWTDPYSGLETVQNDFTLDRGVSFEEACLRLERERAGPGDGSGFYEMRRPLYGAQQVMLAVQKPGNAALFSVVRPNTGASYLDMDAGELSDKYRPCPDEGDARAKWTALYESTLDHCMHGGHCVNGAACQVGRRKSEVTILSGTVVRIWGALEDVLERSAPMLSKGDRAMRVVRLQLEGGGSLVGVRYPRALLPEALAVLVSSQETAAAAGRGGSVFVGAGRKAMDPPTPVDSKALSKALRAPRTMHSFFGKAEASKAPEKENLPETSIPEAAGTLQRRQSCPPAGGRAEGLPVPSRPG
uniref:Nuclear helicase mop-3 sno (Dead-box superfamily) n=1 Tax=Tetraselmis sp. GSL018 TaxID=582737 RepID=A0A061SNZ4_9CHLO